jgi:hypothetical protein
MDRASAYLQIPQPYCQGIGDLRWAANGEAIEYAEGDTFAFRQEIALFFEGFASVRRPIHFGFLLHLLSLLGHSKFTASTQPWELCVAYFKTARPLRNAGVLSALLCRQVPALALPLDVSALNRVLSSGPLMAEVCIRWSAGRNALDTVELPPLAPADFEALVLEALRDFSAKDLEHWLRHGRGPLPNVGETLVREVVPRKPNTLAEALAALTLNPRLSGAVPFVAQLVSALTLPPRRLTHEELPLGGYADVATRGHPEQLLLSQFALDGTEFIRRFAENELLYFRREEPQVQTREELVVLLDQGVRTWGDVRLVLTAAVMALGKLAVRRKIPFSIAATSSEGRCLDPLQVEDRELGELLEASDLTPQPGLALERVLEERPSTARDVVLLTHPRNLGEEDVATAARRVAPGTRLFAVTVDAHGNVRLVEMKHGTAVPRSRFQVEMELPSRLPRPTIKTPAEDEEATVPWKGDVEPIGFPFRFGVVGKVMPRSFAFEHSGGWLVTASSHGMLHLWSVDGTRREVLPRAFLHGEVLTRVEAAMEVIGGFVVIGRIRGNFVVVHYEFAAREVKAHEIGLTTDRVGLSYYLSEFHSVVVRHADGDRGVDLATGARYPGSLPSDGLNTRAQRACQEAQKYVWPQTYLQPDFGVPKKDMPPSLDLDRGTGTVRVSGMDPPWPPFTPEADGRPVLQGQAIFGAQCRGGILALVCGAKEPQLTLRLFRGPEGISLAEYPWVRENVRHGDFTLSRNGQLLARQIKNNLVEVRPTDHSGGPTLITRCGGCHQDLQVEVGPHWLTACVGNWGHLVEWGGEHLKVHAGSTSRRSGAYPLSLQGRKLQPGIARRLPFLRYDPTRFRRAFQGDLTVVVDLFGEILIFAVRGELVCMFFVFRGQLAAWMPDGTRYGPAALTGGPATPDALRKIGQALREAQQRGGGATSW